MFLFTFTYFTLSFTLSITSYIFDYFLLFLRIIHNFQDEKYFLNFPTDDRFSRVLYNRLDYQHHTSDCGRNSHGFSRITLRGEE